MIVRPAKYHDGEWNIDGFRKALGRNDRADSIKFIQVWGSKAGANTDWCHLSWQFLHKRELLDIALPSPAGAIGAPDGDAEHAEQAKEDVIREACR